MLENEECPICRNKGLLDGCPECGKELNIFNSPERKIDFSESKVFIPEYYVNRIWNMEQALTTLPDDNSMNYYKNFYHKLNYLLNGIQQGKTLHNSAIVSAPANYSKSVWVYSCIQSLIVQNKKVVPLISTSEYQRLYNMDVYKPYNNYKYQDFTIEEYNTADILFVEIPDDEAYMYAYETVLKIINIRARFDKPTVFITNVPISKLIAKDYSGTLIRYINEGSDGNPYKYLTAIQCEPIKTEEGVQ